jgi:competence protein ComEC
VIKTKLLQHIWQLNAVTLSAQIFTLPLILYYFHQFPNLLLFTNFFIVPLSGLVLYAELTLLVVSPFTSMAMVMGKIVAFLINQMNGLIERTNRLPFAVTENLQVSITQTVLIYVTIIACLYWLVHKDRKGFWIGLCALLTCIFLRWMPVF